MIDILSWPVIGGGLSALAVFIVGTIVMKHRRNRRRRRDLRSRLFK